MGGDLPALRNTALFPRMVMREVGRKSKRKYWELARIHQVAYNLIDIREDESFQM